jgi:alpha/beta superfamily hydrolase
MARSPLEQAVVIAGEPVLAGILLGAGGGEAPRAAAVIAPPHPLYGGSMENPVVSELAYACCQSGVASLRFDWRGVGGSAGTASGQEAAADADYAAALEELAATVDAPLAACGYSFGAASAVRAAARDPRVRRLVLVAPPPTLTDAEALGAFAGPVLAVVGERDVLAPPDAVAAMLGPEAEPVVVPEADHFFGAGLAALGQSVRRWLAGAAPG